MCDEHRCRKIVCTVRDDVPIDLVVLRLSPTAALVTATIESELGPDADPSNDQASISLS